jgi:protein involved in polysaccharide export with SLBB domain
MSCRIFRWIVILSTVIGCSLHKRDSLVEKPANSFSETNHLAESNQTQFQTLRVHLSGDEPPYLIRFGDQLDIQLLLPTQETHRVLVRPDGRITLPGTGEHTVVGKTLNEVEKLVKYAYANIYRDPVVCINMEYVSDIRYYVFGEVRNPGIFTSKDPINPLQLLALAGGNTSKAKLSSVILLRNLGDGKVSVRLLDLTLLSGEDELGATFKQLYCYDTIIVPQQFIHQVAQILDDYIIQFLPPLDLYLRGMYYMDFVKN